MTTTATTGTTSPVHDDTVRLRPGDLPVTQLPNAIPVIDAKTTRLSTTDPVTKALPKALSGFDGKTVRLRPVDLPGVRTVSDTMRQRYANLKTTESRPTTGAMARIALIMVLAAMPILGISVDVAGLVTQDVTSIVVIVLAAVLGTLVVFAPHRTDMIVGRGLIAGMVACIVYDAARLFAVHVLGLMGDFIPVMGSFVTGEPDTAGSAAVGYIWRYIGDAGGGGVGFFIVAFALGIDRWRNIHAVLAFVVMAVVPMWAGLIATVALLPRGEEMMFDLNPATFVITLIGHVIFGLFLGLAFLKAPRGRGRSDWPYPPILESALVRRMTPPSWKPTHRRTTA